MESKRKYSDFFTVAKKTMSQESIAKAENKANKILFRMKLTELRKESGVKQTEMKA